MQKNMGSHIIIHLVKAKHNQISLHSSNAHKEINIECFYCNSKVLFKLGMVTSTDKSVAILLCREPCLHAKGKLIIYSLNIIIIVFLQILDNIIGIQTLGLH